MKKPPVDIGASVRARLLRLARKQPTTSRERKLAELRTPEVARKWGFRMNMGMDSFESMFAKGAK